MGQKAGLEYGDKIKICVECRKTGNKKYLKSESHNLELYKEKIKNCLERDNSTIILMIQRTKQYWYIIFVLADRASNYVLDTQ